MIWPLFPTVVIEKKGSDINESEELREDLSFIESGKSEEKEGKLSVKKRKRKPVGSGETVQGFDVFKSSKSAGESVQVNEENDEAENGPS
ncbi:hypothetical protein SO802_016721 [Lithocarpus litseifolius]|uniref:Uncharacterized protein n=1 Tax=Lithocarpus litseifolius TaxID=425828 RepID=A0AAW2CXB7_9ROSI